MSEAISALLVKALTVTVTSLPTFEATKALPLKSKVLTAFDKSTPSSEAVIEVPLPPPPPPARVDKST